MDDKGGSPSGFECVDKGRKIYLFILFTALFCIAVSMAGFLVYIKCITAVVVVSGNVKAKYSHHLLK